MGSRSCLSVAVPFACSLLLAAACESTTKPGVIAGIAAPCGGPGPAPRAHPVLTVIVQDLAGKELQHRAVRSPYRFRFAIKSGQYIVAVSRSPDVPKKVHVQPGKTSSVQLINECV